MCCPDVGRDVPHSPPPITNSATPYRAAQPFRVGIWRGTEIKPNYASLPVQWGQIPDPKYHRIPT